MRIFYAVHNHYWEDQNLREGLRELGHEVVTFDPGPFHDALSPTWTLADREKSSNKLIDSVTSAHRRRPLDLFFGYLLNQLVFPEAISAIGELGVPTINYWCNGAHQFSLVDEISPAFDFCVATERQALASYKEVGATAIYLQMAANPRIYRPSDVARSFDVTFVGQRYADRPEYVAYLLKHGIDVKVWGPGWTSDRTFGEQDLGSRVTWSFAREHPRAATRNLVAYVTRRTGNLVTMPPWDNARLARVAGPSLPIAKLVETYSESRISLGFSTCGHARYRDKAKIRQIHLRDFEAPMSRAFYFVEDQEELNEFYDIGREIVTYQSREDLLEKIRYYLSHPDEAERIRDAGHHRAKRDHTWVRRFQQLFRQIWTSPPM